MPPFAVSVADAPLQMLAVAGEIVAIGSAFTVTVDVAVAMHPLMFETVTV